ncbi:MAG TPA: hypothetical protein VMP08_18205 [Anaerolineae bacterium]|nr:hypothetical protein [Anaerolineae bacterium]
MKEIEAPTAPFNQSREWLLWTAAVIGGWLIGTTISLIVSIIISMTGLGAAFTADPASVPQETALILMIISLAMFFVIGAGTGALQWLILRRHINGLQRWALFTGLGFALGAFAFLPFMGIGVGLMQWLLLRGVMNKTGWWAAINAVAWPLGYIFGGGLGVTLGAAINSPLLGNAISAALTGAVIGAITGAVLLWLLRENRLLLDGLRQERAAELAKR